MDEALYVVEFGSTQGTFVNGGVIVLETGRLYGGDSFYYYIGTYQIGSGNVVADAKVVKHSPGGVSVWGDHSDEFQIAIQGKAENGTIGGTMARRDNPDVSLPFRLAKLP